MVTGEICTGSWESFCLLPSRESCEEMQGRPYALEFYSLVPLRLLVLKTRPRKSSHALNSRYGHWTVVGLILTPPLGERQMLWALSQRCRGDFCASLKLAFAEMACLKASSGSRKAPMTSENLMVGKLWAGWVTLGSL